MERLNTFSSLDDVNMPYSLEAEQAVLGSVLIDPSCITQVLILIKPEYFYLPQHRAIFTIMQEIDALGGKIDPLIVLEKLKNEKVYDDANGKQYLLQLSQLVPSTENVEAYSKIIREKYFPNSCCVIVEQTNGGVCKARNKGLDIAQGEYIMFVDADDVLYADAIESLYNLLNASKADIASGDLLHFDTAKGIPGDNRKMMIGENVVWEGVEVLKKSLEDHPHTYSSCAKLYRRELVQSVRFVEGRHVHEDSFFVFQCMLQCPTFVATNMPVYKYRTTPNSASRSAFSDKFLDILFFAEMKAQLIERHFPEFVSLLPNLRIKAYLALLRVLCKTNELNYRSIEKEAISYIIANKEYFKPALVADQKFFRIVTMRLYWLYKLYYQFRFYR